MALTPISLEQANYDFSVIVTDGDSGVNTATLTNDVLRVTGPNSFSKLAAIIEGPTVTYGGKEVTAKYRVPGPFTEASNGTFTINRIAGAAGRVADLAGNQMADGAVETFQCAVGQGSTIVDPYGRIQALGSWNVASTYAQPIGAGPIWQYVTATSLSSANYEVFARLTLSGADTDTATIFTRWQDKDNWLGFTFNKTTTNSIQFRSSISGTISDIGAPVAVAGGLGSAGFTARIEVLTTDDMNVYLNGSTSRLFVRNTTLLRTSTNRRPGFRCTATTATFDQIAINIV